MWPLHGQRWHSNVYQFQDNYSPVVLIDLTHAYRVNSQYTQILQYKKTHFLDPYTIVKYLWSLKHVKDESHTLTSSSVMRSDKEFRTLPIGTNLMQYCTSQTNRVWRWDAKRWIEYTEIAMNLNIYNPTVLWLLFICTLTKWTLVY